MQLLHAQHHATLATHSGQLPGYPYATVLPYVLDEQHRPLLLISELAEHTRNLLADGRCSLAVLQKGAEDVQAEARLSLLADAQRIEVDDLLLQRFLRYQPQAEDLLQLDFMFFRLQPQRLRYIGGVGRMGWLEGAELSPDVLPLAQEAALLQQARVPDGITLLGLDAYGLDYRRQPGAGHQRYNWPEAISQPDALAAALQAALDGLAGK
nr:pyridoxamine 5'-phosphate oxidase family protein [Aquitalea sp. LB_tupeE]